MQVTVISRTKNQARASQIVKKKLSNTVASMAANLGRPNSSRAGKYFTLIKTKTKFSSGNSDGSYMRKGFLKYE